MWSVGMHVLVGTHALGSSLLQSCAESPLIFALREISHPQIMEACTTRRVLKELDV